MKRGRLVTTLMMLGIVTALPGARAATADPAATPAAAASSAAASPAAIAATAPSSAAPAATAPFDAEAETNAYLSLLSPAARARSDAYFEGGYWLILWDCVIALVVAWIFLGTGLSRRMRDKVEAMTRFRWLQSALYGGAYIFLATLFMLPWTFYEGYAREHQYNMSNQNLAAWLADEGKEAAISLVLGAIAIATIYAVVRKTPRTWWLWGSLVTVAFAALGAAIAPVFLEPVFNKFTPLPESPLKEHILSMARAQEIPATDVWLFDASKQTKRMSAHVSGLLGTTRISMNDNLLHRGSPEEILAVLGHEMGHYVLNHVYKGIVFIGLIIVAGFGFIRWSFAAAQRRFGERWGVRDIADVAGFPLVAALFAIFGLLVTPISNTVTRTMEAEADNYGLNASRQPDGFAQAALHLSEYRKMVPGPIEEWVFYDHPSGWHRIHRAMVWKREHLADADIVAYDAAHPGGPASFHLDVQGGPAHE